MKINTKFDDNISVYTYLLGVYFVLIVGYGYSVNSVYHGVVWLLFSAVALIGFALFVAINHIFLKSAIPHRKLFIIESLMLISLIVQIVIAALV